MSQFPTEYTLPYLVTSYDADLNRNLRLSALLRIQQEAGEQHLRAGGLSYGTLYDMGFIFVLTRTHLVVRQLPKFGDPPVSCLTWSNGAAGSQFTRSYVLSDSDGHVLTEGCSAFALMDAATYRLLRPSALGETLDALPHWPDRVSCPPPTKLKSPDPATFTPAGMRPVRHSDIDYNHHLNNTNYADFLFDFYPGGAERLLPRECTIQFSGQALLGDTIEIGTAMGDGGVYVRGAHERGVCFTAHLTVSTL